MNPHEHRSPAGEHHYHHDGLLHSIRHGLMPHSHDTVDKVDSALETNALGIRAVKVSLVILAVTSAAQVVIVAASGSVALAADTVHNVSDALTAVPLWIAFSLGRRAASRRFTYGYGRAEDIAGLFVLAMITLSALIAGYQAVCRLIHPVPVQHLSWVAAAGFVGFVGNEIVAVYRIRAGRRIGSAALVADGLHARADGVTSLAVVLGAAAVVAGYPLADPIIGLVITAVIVGVLGGAAREVFARLMDAVDPELISSAESALETQPGVLAVRAVRMRWIGHSLHADAELDIDPSTTVSEAHRIAHDAEHVLTHRIPRLSSALIHAYPHPV